MDDCPAEILLEIFSYFDKNPLDKTWFAARQVCWRWQELIAEIHSFDELDDTDPCKPANSAAIGYALRQKLSFEYLFDWITIIDQKNTDYILESVPDVAVRDIIYNKHRAHVLFGYIAIRRPVLAKNFFVNNYWSFFDNVDYRLNFGYEWANIIGDPLILLTDISLEKFCHIIRRSPIEMKNVREIYYVSAEMRRRDRMNWLAEMFPICESAKAIAEVLFEKSDPPSLIKFVDETCS